MKIETPCVNICKLDERGICIGCFRSLQEIAAWSRMSEAERFSIMTNLAARTNFGAPGACSARTQIHELAEQALGAPSN